MAITKLSTGPMANSLGDLIDRKSNNSNLNASSIMSRLVPHHHDSDNVSTTSTASSTTTADSASIDSTSSPLGRRGLPVPKRRRRRRNRSHSDLRMVRFDETQNTEYANTQWYEEECPGFWYTDRQLRQIKAEATALAKIIRRKEQDLEVSYMSVLLGAYDMCCEATPTSNAACMETTSAVLSAEHLMVLSKFVGRANSRTGLERCFIREICDDKKWRRAELIMALEDVQEECITAAAATAAEASVSFVKLRHRRAVLQRQVSETISYASRQFAHSMALALHLSLTPKESQEQEIIKAMNESTAKKTLSRRKRSSSLDGCASSFSSNGTCESLSSMDDSSLE